MVKPFKFTRNSGCLARDEFLVEGDHMLIYIFGFLFLFLGTVLHCISWCEVFAVVN